MEFPQILQRADGGRVNIEAFLETECFDDEPHTWSFQIYYCAPGEDVFKDVTLEHLDGPSYATQQEILDAQLRMWESFKPTLNEQIEKQIKHLNSKS